MNPRRETLTFAAALASLVFAFLGESLAGGKILSPADVVYVQPSFAEFRGPAYEPANRLLMDPVLQCEPWLEFSRAELRRGRLPLWNPYVGCGAPHLANGQSAVFDPFHLIAYLGPLPQAHAWMAAARLWVAGLGMFLLARAWGLGRWGRWFAGLGYPFCGFLVVWLLYTVTSVAVWMPWVFLAGEAVLRAPRPRTVAALACATGFTILGGHIQTCAHILGAAAVYVGWRVVSRTSARPRASACAAWSAGIVLGIALAAIEVLPLGAYLTRSPVWGDRLAEREPFWAIGRPRLLDAACTALPYTYGSQRRGHPNLAPAFGVHNLNESAGGFAGLATLLWLAPLGWSARRQLPLARFLAALATLAFLGAFAIPPASNLLRAVPVLDVVDHRRLSLLVAFGLLLLGGIGLDRVEECRLGRGWGRWAALWIAGGLVLAASALAVGLMSHRLLPRALAHYTAALAEEPGADASMARALAERQVGNVMAFFPRYYGLAAAHLAALAALALAIRRGKVGAAFARPALLGLTLADLFAFGHGLNPATEPADRRPAGAVIEHLRREAPPPARILALGGDLPPNMAMRYGLADVRNYDSVEARRNLDWFGPLYESGPATRSKTSRRTVTWDGVVRARDRLREAGVRLVVGATAPPPGHFARVDRVGRVWVAHVDGAAEIPTMAKPGEIRIDAAGVRDDRRVVPVTFDPGWKAEIDGRAVALAADRGAFLALDIPAGSRRVTLRYDPPEVRLAAVVSLLALAAIVACLALDRRRGIPAGKNGPRSWMASAHRVRIESVTSSWPLHRLPAEGCDADGPLHV
jgi:hypothetical protein